MEKENEKKKVEQQKTLISDMKKEIKTLDEKQDFQVIE